MLVILKFTTMINRFLEKRGHTSEKRIALEHEVLYHISHESKMRCEFCGECIDLECACGNNGKHGRNCRNKET